MPYVAVDKDGSEFIYCTRPVKVGNKYAVVHRSFFTDGQSLVLLPTGTIKKLIGKKLTWDDDPIELT